LFAGLHHFVPGHFAALISGRAAQDGSQKGDGPGAPNTAKLFVPLFLQPNRKTLESACCPAVRLQKLTVARLFSKTAKPNPAAWQDCGCLSHNCEWQKCNAGI